MSFTNEELGKFYISNLDVRLLGQFRVQHIETAYLAGLREGQEQSGKRIFKLEEALQYYAHPDHYEPRVTLGGERPPGVVTEGGAKARKVLGKKAQIPENDLSNTVGGQHV